MAECVTLILGQTNKVAGDAWKEFSSMSNRQNTFKDFRGFCEQLNTFPEVYAETVAAVGAILSSDDLSPKALEPISTAMATLAEYVALWHAHYSSQQLKNMPLV